jgi:hypothetical protein
LAVASLRESGLQKFPTRIAFGVQHQGSKATLDFRADKTRAYLFQLAFGFADAAGRERLRGLVGRDSRRAAIRDGNAILPISLHMTLARLGSPAETIIYDRTVADMRGTGFTAKEFVMQIDRVALDPGDYRVNVESLRELPELADVPISLLVTIYSTVG